jgi:hypothetical protein
MLYAGQDGEKDTIFSGSMSLMQPQDIRQYIYILQPVASPGSPVIHEPGTIIPLGRLDLSWRSAFGEPGRLLTSVSPISAKDLMRTHDIFRCFLDGFHSLRSRSSPLRQSLLTSNGLPPLRTLPPDLTHHRRAVVVLGHHLPFPDPPPLFALAPSDQHVLNLPSCKLQSHEPLQPRFRP